MKRTKNLIQESKTKKLVSIADLGLSSGDPISVKINMTDYPFEGKLRFIKRGPTGDYEFVRHLKGGGLIFYHIKDERVKIKEDSLEQRNFSRIPSYMMPLDNPANLAYFHDLMNKLKLGEQIF